MDRRPAPRRGTTAWLRAAMLAVAVALLAAPAPPAAGHDFWIEIATANPSGGERSSPGVATALHLCVGEQLAGDERALSPARASRAELWTDGGLLSFLPEVEEIPPTLPRGARAGVVVYASRPAFVSLEPERFTAYLGSERLEGVIAERAARDESQRAGHERYFRAAKALVGAEPLPLLATRAFGLRLEIVPGADPRALGPDDPLPVQLLWEGEPLEGSALLHLVRRPVEGEGRLVEEQRTDERGFSVLRRGGPGLHLIKAIHMVRVEDDPAADWESVWASLTYVLP